MKIQDIEIKSDIDKAEFKDEIYAYVESEISGFIDIMKKGTKNKVILKFLESYQNDIESFDLCKDEPLDLLVDSTIEYFEEQTKYTIFDKLYDEISFILDYDLGIETANKVKAILF